MADKIYLNGVIAYRQDTLENWTSINPVLERGEPAIVRDGGDGEWLKIGDGITAFNDLPYKKGSRGEKGETGPQGPQGEQGVKGEQGEKGADGKDAVTDLHYNPESENAQSGIAVAEAVSYKADKIVNSASGESILLTDSSNYALEGLKVYGKSTQDGTPTPEVPIPIVSAGASGSVEVKVCGKNLADVWGVYGAQYSNKQDNSVEIVSIEGNTLKVKVIGNIHNIRIPVIKSITAYSSKWTISGADKEWQHQIRNHKGTVHGTSYNSGKININNITDGTHIGWVQLFLSDGSYIPKNKEITIEGYVNEGVANSIQTPYVEPQTLTLATPNELRSVPVNNGYTGDYILENGKRKVCDYIDLEKGVRVERTWSATTDSTTNWDLSGSPSGRIEVKCFLTEYHSNVTTKGGYSNLLPYQGTTTDNNNFFNVGYTGIYVSFDGKYFGGTIPTLEEVKAFLKENPITIYTHRKTPLEIPLTAEELAYYKALHTNYPNTTIFNSDGTNMDVSYIADTKLYIDNKFAELSAAIVNNA